MSSLLVLEQKPDVDDQTQIDFHSYKFLVHIVLKQLSLKVTMRITLGKYKFIEITKRRLSNEGIANNIQRYERGRKSNAFVFIFAHTNHVSR